MINKICKLIGLSTLCALFALPSHSADRTARIVGGTAVTGSDFPWMAAIYFRTEGSSFTPICGGSLISDRWIMTAAHCVFDNNTSSPQDASSLAFLLGSLDLSGNDGIFASVSRVVVHPDYNPNSLLNDIALLELPEPVDIQPVVLSTRQNPVPLDGENSTVIGWGATEEGGSITALLQEVDLPIVTHAACRAFYPGLDASGAVCAGGLPDGGRDSCQGDSGGPLFVPRGEQLVQAGVVSSGLGCARPGIPGVYTRVSNYFEWISTFVNGTTVYDGSHEEGIVTIPDVVQLQPANSAISGSVAEGGADFYTATGINQVTLNTLQGDADLLVFSSPDLSAESLVCVSQEVVAIDQCALGSIDDYFVAVFGFEDSDYSLTFSDGSQPISETQIEQLQIGVATNGSLQADTAVIYTAEAGDEATLTSVSGDADLYVFSDEEFNFDTLLCTSLNEGSALDSCVYGAGNSPAYVMVFGKSDTTFSLVTSSTSSPADTPVLPQSGPEDPVQSDNGSSSSGGGGGVFNPLLLLSLFSLRILHRRKAL